MEREILRRKDLELISEFIRHYASDDFRIGRKRKKSWLKYADILSFMAGSMLEDDGIVVREGWFDREHGV